MRIQTTQFPQYQRGILWFIGILSSLIVMLWYFWSVHYSLVSLLSIVLAIIVYGIFVMFGKNDHIILGINKQTISINNKSIPIKKCRFFSIAQGDTTRPDVLIIKTERFDYSVPIPTKEVCQKVKKELSGYLEYKEKIPLIYRFLHYLKV